jgi:hypothetical protein
MRTFGIEIELHVPAGKTGHDLARHISTTANVACRFYGYTHAVVGGWKVVTDASLAGGNGLEVVSPILSGEEGIDEARRVAAAVESFGCRVRVDCGFHLHVGTAGLNLRNLKNIAKCFVKFETFFDNIVPASRRANVNRYVMSNRSHFGGYGNAAANRGLSAIDAVASQAEFLRLFGGSRFHKLNIQAMTRQPTIEFRQHSGTTSPDKIEHWIRLLLAFVNGAANARPRARSVVVDRTPAEEMNRFFGMFDVPAATRAFYVARRRELHRDSAAA